MEVMGRVWYNFSFLPLCLTSLTLDETKWGGCFWLAGLERRVFLACWSKKKGVFSLLV